MQKKFITNLALLLFLNLLIKPFWILGIDREVQNIVGSEDYGIYFALFNFSFLLNALLDIGITNFNNRNIAQHTQLLTKHFSNIVGLKFLLGVLYTIITLAIAFLIGYEGKQLYLLLVLCFNQFLISFILYVRSNISGLHLFKTDSIISVLDRVVMIAVCGLLLWGNITDRPFDVEQFIYTQTIGYGVTAIIAFVVVYHKAETFTVKWNPAFFVSILRKSFPFALLILLMMFYNRADSIILERLLPDGAEQSGIYAQAYRLLDAANMIGYLFAGLLLPLFARMLKLKEAVNQLLNLSFSLIISLAVVTAVGSYYYRYELMALLYDQKVVESAQVYGLLMFSFISISATHIYGTLLTANGNLKHLNIIAGVGVIISFTLNFILIPLYKAQGAAVAGLATHTFVALSLIISTGKIFRFNIKYNIIALTVLFSGGVVAISYYSTLLPFAWGVNFILMVATCFAWALITRIIGLKSIYNILKHG